MHDYGMKTMSTRGRRCTQFTDARTVKQCQWQVSLQKLLVIKWKKLHELKYKTATWS